MCMVFGGLISAYLVMKIEGKRFETFADDVLRRVDTLSDITDEAVTQADYHRRNWIRLVSALPAHRRQIEVERYYSEAPESVRKDFERMLAIYSEEKPN